MLEIATTMANPPIFRVNVSRTLNNSGKYNDNDKAALGDISNNESLPQGVRMMASAGSSINHSPSDQSKQMMAQLQAAAQAPDQVKSLARIIADFNHMPSDEEKATLAQLFP